MKKIYTLLTMMMLSFLLYSCAASDTSPTIDLNMNDNLYFDWINMTYTHSNSYDIFYDTSNACDDFFILYQINELPLIENDQKDIYAQTFELLCEFSNVSNYSFQSIFSFNSSDLINAFETYQLTPLTLDEIVGFNQLKLLVNDTKTNATIINYITRLEYIEIRLNLSLETIDIATLDLAQYLYVQFRFDGGLPLSEYESVDALLLDAMDIGFILTEDQITAITYAYTIYLELKN